MKRAIVCLGMIALTSPVFAQAPGSQAAALKTRPELTDYRETSRYDEVVAFRTWSRTRTAQVVMPGVPVFS